MTWHVQKVDLEVASVVTAERYHVPGSGSHTVKAVQAWPAPLWGEGSCCFPAQTQPLRPHCTGIARDVFAWERLGEWWVGWETACARLFYFLTWHAYFDREATRLAKGGSWDLNTTCWPKFFTEHQVNKVKGMEKHLPGKNISPGFILGLFLPSPGPGSWERWILLKQKRHYGPCDHLIQAIKHCLLPSDLNHQSSLQVRLIYFAFLVIAPFPCPMTGIMCVHVQWWNHAGICKWIGLRLLSSAKAPFSPVEKYHGLVVARLLVLASGAHIRSAVNSCNIYFEDIASGSM